MKNSIILPSILNFIFPPVILNDHIYYNYKQRYYDEAFNHRLPTKNKNLKINLTTHISKFILIKY